MKMTGKRLLCLLLSAAMLVGALPTGVMAVTEDAFVLVAEANGALVIAPEYVTYTQGQTLQEALAASGHVFTGLDSWMISEIDGVVGNYTRSDEDGDFALDKMAAEVEYFRFSEAENSQPSPGLQKLMTAMAEYQRRDADVQAAAWEAYDTAYSQFVGIDSASAAVLAENLNTAISDYENAQSGTQYKVTFSDGSNVYSGVSITAENPYGKVWTDDGDGVLELPAGDYTFCVSHNGLYAQGSITVTADMTVQAALPENLWLDLDSFRLSGSYGSGDNEENKFTDDEFKIGAWNDRQATAAVTDTFTGTVYTYAEYDADLLSRAPTLTAIYSSAQTGAQMRQNIPFESLTSGAPNVLGRGAAGNTVIYRVSAVEADGYTYAQDYTVNFERIPSLRALSVADQNGVDQTAVTRFSGDVTAYVYKVVDTVTAVTVTPTPLDESYTVTVNGQDAASGVTVALEDAEETIIEVTVSANGYSNTYTLHIRPGEGKALSFITASADVTVEVVNSNGEVMPFERFKEGASGNRYQYILVPGETYSYVATAGTYYHIADEFTMEDVADSTIELDVPREDWLAELAFGTKSSSKYKNTLPLDSAFVSADHSYGAEYVDTEHLAYVWVATEESDVTIQAIYNQIFASALYHGKQQIKSLTSGAATGVQLNRFLMDENPIENTVTIRLTKEADGITYYQDYIVDFSRTLTLEDLGTKCDGITASLVQEDGSIGFSSDVKEYAVTVSMAAETLDLSVIPHAGNTCYGEEAVGYRVVVDGVDVTEAEAASIALDGSLETQSVTITVENSKAPDGSSDYVLHILKSPPVEAIFEIDPENALLNLRERLSGERLWSDEKDAFQLCEGYSYDYTLTQYGYVGRSGTISVTRDEAGRLVVTDGTDSYLVTENEAGGGTVTIPWTLERAAVNSTIDASLTSEWENFRGAESNNAVTDAAIPTAAEDGTLYWANQIGSGIDSDAVGSPILVDGYLITYASDKLFRVDTITGEVVATGTMDHKSSFSITPPTYAEGMVFVALSNGTVQAFNAVTLESLWIYADPLGGQPNCPLTVKNGYLYTGFWNSETGDANFVCLSITDEDPGQGKENKIASWYYTAKGGYYWAGAFASDDYVLVGTDDGTNTCTSQTSRLLLLDPKTGALLDSWDGLNGDIRSSIVYDADTDAYYFTSKGGSFYSVQVNAERKLANMWSTALSNGTKGTPMSTCSPVVYNGRAYVGVSGAGQFAAYSGHNITVIDLNQKAAVYSVQTQGYPQTSGLLTTAYEEESGYVYVYFFDNMTPGKLRVLRDQAGQTAADYVTTEDAHSTAYALFTPTGDQAQYAICSPVVDAYGTVYFKNDSAYLMAFGSAIKKIEVTTLPDKTAYAEGETFDPTGMVVTATYANGKTRDITNYVTCSADALTEENAVVTISFEHVMYHNAENGTSMTAGVAATTPTVTLELTIGEDTAEQLRGDVNMDGTIDTRDANLVVSYYYGNEDLGGQQMELADVDGNGGIDVQDANLIVSYYYGNMDAFPAES
ncbi:MAG: cadherin-like beta sandwich domain-containing protein [Oscillospiraceae bacterium]|nr:cadherin-like beta sandwich domain-containing protein [Oscillospiraceae bacterium]